jgi:hypothetical protein
MPWWKKQPPLITTAGQFKELINEQAGKHLSKNAVFFGGRTYLFFTGDRYYRVPTQDECLRVHRKGFAHKQKDRSGIVRVQDRSLIPNPDKIIEEYPNGDSGVSQIDPDCDNYAKHLQEDFLRFHNKKHNGPPEYCVAQVWAKVPNHAFNVALIQMPNPVNPSKPLLRVMFLDSFTRDKSLRFWAPGGDKPIDCYLFLL